MSQVMAESGAIIGADHRGTDRPWFVGWRLALIFLAVAFVLHVPALSDRVFNADEAYVATQAQVLNHGGKLYTDTVDRKPPILPLLYAGTFRITGSDDLVPVRVLAILAEVLTACLLALEARRRFRHPRAGLIAGLLFLGSAVSLYAKDAQAANFEIFMLPAMVAAVVVAFRRRPFAAGLCIAIAALTQQTAMLTIIPVAWITWQEQAAPRDRATRARLKGLGAVALGVLVPVIAAAFVFGPGPFVRWTITSNGGYLDATDVLGFTLTLGAYQWARFLLANLAIVVLCAMAWRRRRDDAELWLWAATGTVAVFSGLRFFGHYYLQLVPVLALLATRPLLGASRKVLVLVTVSMLTTIGWFAVSGYAPSATRAERTAQALAGYARRHSPEGASILVWGHLPEVYWESDRPPATRFATTGFLTGLSGGRPKARVGMQFAVPGAWRDFERDLHEHPPTLVFDLSPANVRDAKYFPPSRYPWFAAWLSRSYHRVAALKGVGIYARN
jgi:hypothetical protein